MADDLKCPIDGGTMHPSGETSADEIERSSSTSGVNVAAAAKHARDIREKNEREGLLYTCERCGYHMRVKAGGEPASQVAAAQPPAAPPKKGGGASAQT